MVKTKGNFLPQATMNEAGTVFGCCDVARALVGSKVPTPLLLLCDIPTTGMIHLRMSTAPQDRNLQGAICTELHELFLLMNPSQPKNSTQVGAARNNTDS